MVMGISIFIKTPSLGDSQTRLRSDAPAHEKETIPCQTSGQYFKTFFRVNAIFKKVFVCGTPILTFQRHNSLNEIIIGLGSVIKVLIVREIDIS